MVKVTGWGRPWLVRGHKLVRDQDLRTRDVDEAILVKGLNERPDLPPSVFSGSGVIGTRSEDNLLDTVSKLRRGNSYEIKFIINLN